MPFAKEQPRDGDTILHCGHLLDHGASRACPAHWFKFDEVVGFERPDGSVGEASWLAVCEPCFVRHGERVADFIRGAARWIGDEPAIEKVES